jgi:hypothetical protein
MCDDEYVCSSCLGDDEIECIEADGCMCINCWGDRLLRDIDNERFMCDMGDLFNKIQGDHQKEYQIKWFYVCGRHYKYNLCCIRRFIENTTFDKPFTHNNFSLGTGVIFCEECSINIREDRELQSILYRLTLEDD